MNMTKVSSLALGSLVLAGACIAKAAQSPFTAESLTTGYQVALADKTGEGKCGEGKCGEKKDGEGKCGEGKCGEKKDSEGKCGEGKCGEKKAE